MTLPRFTAEKVLRSVDSWYGYTAILEIADDESVIAQYTCSYTRCDCFGYEDCYKMYYKSSICWSGSFSCSWSPRGVDCTCIPAIV